MAPINLLCRCKKLGLAAFDSPLFEELKLLLHGVDYTIFWRQLSGLANRSQNPSELLELLPAFYREASESPSPPRNAKRWELWLQNWRLLLDPMQASRMKEFNPKYIPREWLLIEAYQAAEIDNLEPLHRLQKLLAHPYDEEPLENVDCEKLYYRKTPEVFWGQGGASFMS